MTQYGCIIETCSYPGHPKLLSISSCHTVMSRHKDKPHFSAFGVLRCPKFSTSNLCALATACTYVRILPYDGVCRTAHSSSARSAHGFQLDPRGFIGRVWKALPNLVTKQGTLIDTTVTLTEESMYNNIQTRCLPRNPSSNPSATALWKSVSMDPTQYTLEM